MDTRFYSLLNRLEANPQDELAWQQVKRKLRQEPEQTCCQLFFGHLVDSQTESALETLLVDRWQEVFREVVTFYRAFLDRTETYGDIWGGGKEFWLIAQFLEVWTERIKDNLPTQEKAALAQVLGRLRVITNEHKIVGKSSGPDLPFLPQEVAWNLPMYLKPASILADYPEFKHMYFLSSEILPLAFDLENYKLSPRGEQYLESLLHETRQEAFKANLLNFAQNFPLVLQAKWAYAVYISLARGGWCQHPFVRRLLANSYWEAKATGHVVPFNVVE
ncbi:MAG TPA: hypothetical protein VNU93_06620 [Verrucomicrobiae bacterium]|nr:hypothetical protein [Verrucomicrobiae bacterium]